MALELLDKNGIISIVAYTGHKVGENENNDLINYLATLNTKCYTVRRLDYVNRANKPPIIYLIHKKKL